MKASCNWLFELCPALPKDPSALAERFTRAGLEVEAVIPYGAASKDVRIVEVLGEKPHPSRSELKLVTVGAPGQTVEVVCGAKNVPAPGGRVVYAPSGVHLPAKGITLSRRVIGGVASDGMLVSESELGLSDHSDGILVLTACLGKDAVGKTLSEVLPETMDTVLELGLTPNRADCLGHVGLAREASALFLLGPWTYPQHAAPSSSAESSGVRIRIDEPERCQHYGFAEASGVTIAPSPRWMRYRLSSLGIRSISNVVDITNLAMMLFGHPMHAFDRDRLRGDAISVRLAKPGEILRTLDGVDRSLASDDLLIADEGGGLALAGVMGGGESEVSATTTRILFECAMFEPRGVRRVSRRHGLHTESSHRFERGVDPEDTRAVLAYALALLQEVSPQSRASTLSLQEARPARRVQVSVRPARMEALLGVYVARSEAQAILARLGLSLLSSTDQVDTYEVPAARSDLQREVDLIEEVVRVRGLDVLPRTLPKVIPGITDAPRETRARAVRREAVALGLSEAVTLGFVSRDGLRAVGAPEPAVVLQNPLREEESVMRTSLLPGLLKALSHAGRHGERNVRLFSLGSVFRQGEPPLPSEPLFFAMLLAGDRPSHLSPPVPVDVWDGTGVLTALLERLFGMLPAFVPLGDQERALHPRASARVEVGGKPVGLLGMIHPDLAAWAEVGTDVVLAELHMDLLFEAPGRDVRFRELPKFPASTRDMALVLKEDAGTAASVVSTMAEEGGALVEEVTLFDRFVGGKVPEGHASLAFRIVYRAADRTLTDKEIEEVHTRVLDKVSRQFGASLRI